ALNVREGDEARCLRWLWEVPGMLFFVAASRADERAGAGWTKGGPSALKARSKTGPIRTDVPSEAISNLPYPFSNRRSKTMPVTDQEKAAKARDAALQGALTQIEREFGKGTVMRMGDEGAQVRCEAIPTGALSLDLALGIGGVPRGRIVEVFGPESSGKTTMIYH